jgi:hypothetical protein
MSQQKYANNHTEKIFNKYVSHKHNGGGSNNINYAHTLMMKHFISLALGIQSVNFNALASATLSPPYSNI